MKANRSTMRKTAGAVLALALLAAPAVGAAPAPDGVADRLGVLWERALHWLMAPFVVDDAAPAEEPPPPLGPGEANGERGSDIDPNG